MKNSHLFVGVALILGGGFFVLAITSTFTLSQVLRSRFDPVEMVFINVIAGLVEIFIGYESMVIFGGRLSLGVAEFVSRIANSKQVIEVRREQPSALKHKLIRDLFLAYVPLIVFMLTVSIAWDFYNADTVRSGAARPLLHFFDIFARPSTNVILYSVQVTPFVVLFSFLAGVVPSISLPYFRKFKVTGVNSGPFHTTLMISVVGVLAGVSALFTLFGLFYEVLLVNRLPLYYRYILLVAVGFSLYYGVGSYLGLGRAEEMVRKELVGKKWHNVFEGSVALAPND